jgi:O-antigen/teichoic acid export membrane protein
VALGFNGVTLKVLGKIRYVLTSNLSSELIKIVLCLLLIPRFGALGAAASVLVGMIAYNILMQWGLHRVAHVRMLGREYVPLAMLIFVSIFSLFSLREVVGHNIYLAVSLTVIATTILLLAAKNRLSIATTFPEALRVPVLGRLLA